ncbi:putative transporter [Pseudoloma neurophilia]|uniref:Putative transporter n=1 Tax=Pseudoloma neurophilia TaxID=146866 RepID=A0A0R0M557_9MICR|nr:putative transporter [Pseudoloma neurophilia]
MRNYQISDLSIPRIHLLGCIFFISRVYFTIGLFKTVISIIFFGTVSFFASSMIIDVRRVVNKNLEYKARLKEIKHTRHVACSKKRKKPKKSAVADENKKHKIDNLAVPKQNTDNSDCGFPSEERTFIGRRTTTENSEKQVKISNNVEKKQKTHPSRNHKPRTPGISVNPFSILQKSLDMPIFRQPQNIIRKTINTSSDSEENEKMSDFGQNRPSDAIDFKKFNDPVVLKRISDTFLKKLNENELKSKNIQFTKSKTGPSEQNIEKPSHEEKIYKQKNSNCSTSSLKTMNKPLKKQKNNKCSTLSLKTMSKPLNKTANKPLKKQDFKIKTFQKTTTIPSNKKASNDTKKLQSSSNDTKKPQPSSNDSIKPRSSHKQQSYFVVNMGKCMYRKASKYTDLILYIFSELQQLYSICMFVLNILSLLVCFKMTFEFSEELVKQDTKVAVFILFFISAIIIKKSRSKRVIFYETAILIIFILCCFLEYIICMVSQTESAISQEKSSFLQTIFHFLFRNGKTTTIVQKNEPTQVQTGPFSMEPLAFLIWAFTTHPVTMNDTKFKILIDHIITVSILILLGLMRYFSFLKTLSHFLAYPFVLSRLKIIILQIISYRKIFIQVIENDLCLSKQSKSHSFFFKLLKYVLNEWKCLKIILFTITFSLAIFFNYSIIKSLFFIFGSIEMYIIVSLLHIRAAGTNWKNISLLFLGMTGFFYGVFLFFTNIYQQSC